MLKIRLQRVGRKHEPVFRIVLTDSKNSTKSGRFLEILGSYDPRDKQTTKVNGERVKYWVSKGAQMSATLNNLVINQGILEGKKINVLPKKTPIVKEKTEEEIKTESTPEVKEETPTESTPEVVEETPAEEIKSEEVPAPKEEEKVEEAPEPVKE